jgi:hypothetical protein
MKLCDYYKQTVAINDSGKGGWASYYYGVFSKIIRDNNYKNVAEIGIGYGTHSKEILMNTAVSNLYLIDPMKYYPNDGFAADIMNQESNNHFEEMVSLINEELSPWEERYTWFRQPSLSITNEQIPDESLDCIFIDGDHSYEAVTQDLEFWWAKLKKGGKLLGDDFWMEGVAKAVKEFASKKKMLPAFLNKPGTNYKIYCFSKK